MHFKMRLILMLIFLEGLHQISGQAYHLKFHQSPEENFSCILIEDDHLPYYRGLETSDQNELKYSINPAAKVAQDNQAPLRKDDKIVEVFSNARSVAEAFMESMCKSVKKVEPLHIVASEDGKKKIPEIRKIVDGGDQRNRIDVVFMGDGYTASERDQFFEDIQRLTKDMFEGVTFRSYLPLFNIWAVYVESNESGIGYDGPKDTAFGLFRESGQLRAIYSGNSQYAREVCALLGTSGCDYPSLIGNDDFYGGLGGEFVISTKSERTGTVVLRHEMGHNFVNVGEEYDNGYVYRGVNSASSVSTLGWTAWLSGERKEERAIYRLLEYPWADLSEGPKSYSFTSDGAYSRWNLVLTVSAAGEEDSLEFLLDGEVLPWKTSGYDDREFYMWSGDEGFQAGQHNFSVRSKTNSTHPMIPRMICSIRLHEYGNEDEFHSSDSYVSAYPTWDANGRKVFRPTSEGCLMRNMTNPHFCPVCQEGMWSQFFQRVSLIDNVTVTNSSENGKREVTVQTLKLGQLRAPGNEVDGETLEVKWYKDNQEQIMLRDQFSVNAEPGNWAVEVHFNTTEVRNDPRDLLTSTQTFIVPTIE